VTLLDAPIVEWTSVARASAPAPERRVTRRSVVVRITALGVLAALVVVAAAGLVADRLAVNQAIDGARTQTRILALDVAEPAVQNGLASGSPAAVTAFARAVRASVANSHVVAMKVWNPDGRIVYATDARLIGRRFSLDPAERHALTDGTIQADVSNLQDPDNVYERGRGRLLEVHQGIHAPDGTPLLFEVYLPYDQVLAAGSAIWAGFAIVTGASVFLLLAALIPFINRMVRALERSQQQREALLTRAIDAADAERRRVAAAVHDGPVQDLVGASFQLGAAAAFHAGSDVGATLETAEMTVRGTIEGVRSALTDIYPAALADSELAAALRQLAAQARSRGAVVMVHVEDDLELTTTGQQLVFRVAREALANSVKHGDGSPIQIRLVQNRSEVVLTVGDDGPGFDPSAAITSPAEGHFGLRSLQDAVAESNLSAELELRSAPGAGTAWRLTIAASRPRRR
jgi:signal transduction histidine kinase